MALNDPLANVLSNILNSENVGKQEVKVKHNSKVIAKVLTIMKDQGYLKDFEPIENSKEKIIKIKLAGKINNANVIKPRYSFKKDQLEKYEKRYLPGKGIGMILVSTSKGIMTHKESQNTNMGGRLIAYVY